MLTGISALVQQNLKANTAVMQTIAGNFNATVAQIVATITQGATTITKDEIAQVQTAIGQLTDALKGIQSSTSAIIAVLKPALDTAVQTELANLKSALTLFVGPLQSLATTMMGAADVKTLVSGLTLSTLSPVLKTLIGAI